MVIFLQNYCFDCGQNISERSLMQMLWILAAVLFGLWLLGVLTAYTLNGLIHILLVIAIVVVVVRLVRGKKVFTR